MANKIENDIRRLFERVLLNSNFIQSNYTSSQLILLCRKSRAFEAALIVLRLKGISLSADAIRELEKIKNFACN